MSAFKYLPVIALLALSPTLQAAESFVSHYEPLHNVSVREAEYASTNASEDRQPVAPVVFSFEALGKRFDLDLEPNDRIMAAMPESAAFEGVSVYRGRLLNNPDSWVRVVMFDGIPRGLVWDGEAMFAIEAPGDSAVANSEPIIYRLADLNIVPGTMTCGTESLSGTAEKMYARMSGEMAEAVTQAPGAVSEISMSVLGDSLFTNAQGGSVDAAVAITARFNNIDGYFSEQVGVQLNVQRIETFDDATDPFDATLDSNNLLDQLSEYRLQTPAHNSLGLTHMYTGRNFDTTTVGVAWRGTICENYFGAGVSEGRVGLTTDSLIAAHEIGHNFGAEHDGQAESPCASEPETFIMAPSVSGNDQFSACSISVMQAVAAAASCVTALPAVDVGIRQNAPGTNILLGANTVIDYEVSVGGTLGVADVVADFEIPGVLNLDSITSSTGTCSSGAGTASCTLGNLSGLSKHTVTITATPSAVGAGDLSASVTTSDTDERPTNNVDTLSLIVDPAVDLVVNTPATTPVFIDNSTTVTAMLENVSIMDATNVLLSITLASGLQADSASWSIGTCTVAPQQIDCQATSFDAQTSSTLSISATATATGLQDVSVSLSSAEADANAANNSASRSVNVVTPQSEEEDSGGGTTSPWFLLLIALTVARLSARSRSPRMG